jgi:hypothetical protein
MMHCAELVVIFAICLFHLGFDLLDFGSNFCIKWKKYKMRESLRMNSKERKAGKSQQEHQYLRTRIVGFESFGLL